MHRSDINIGEVGQEGIGGLGPERHQISAEKTLVCGQAFVQASPSA